ncbi:MAG: hypothetical protein ACLFUB_07470 [Cyclobacteriaceae bacterium]
MSRRRKVNVRESLRQFASFFPSNKDKLKVITLCVLAATTFWFFSALNKSNYVTRLKYPLVFEYEEDSIYTLSTLPENVLIEVSGGGWNLLRKTLLFDTPPVTVNIEEPDNTPYITGQSLSQSIAEQLGEVRLNEVVTDTLFLDFDKAVQKQVGLALDSSSLMLEEGVQLISPISISPRKVTLLGPRTIMQDVDDTLYISLREEEIGGNYRGSVVLEYVDSDLVEVKPAQAIVSFRAAPFQQISRELVVSLRNFPEDSSLQILPNRVDVSFRIQDKYINSIRESDFEVVADLRTLSLEDSTIILVIKSYPEFARDINIQPVKVRVINAE